MRLVLLLQGYSSGTAIKVISSEAAENYQEDMILTGQVYLLMRYHKGIKAIWVFYLFFWYLVLAAQ
jgi:hypothetical protein